MAEPTEPANFADLPPSVDEKTAHSIGRAATRQNTERLVLEQARRWQEVYKKHQAFSSLLLHQQAPVLTKLFTEQLGQDNESAIKALFDESLDPRVNRKESDVLMGIRNMMGLIFQDVSNPRRGGILPQVAQLSGGAAVNRYFEKIFGFEMTTLTVHSKANPEVTAEIPCIIETVPHGIHGLIDSVPGYAHKKIVKQTVYRGLYAVLLLADNEHAEDQDKPPGQHL